VALSDLYSTGDVAALLLRPLTTDEQASVAGLIPRASDLLRNAVPSIDDRMARWSPGTADKGAVSQKTVATVVAGVIKRYMRNPDGLASEAAGPFSASYALRGDKAPRGVLEVTADDLTTLFPNRKRPRAGTIRTRPGLAPRPVGRYGPLAGPDQVLAAVVDWSADPPVDGGEVVEWALGPDGSTA
jgi:hypothetical protein